MEALGNAFGTESGQFMDGARRKIGVLPHKDCAGHRREWIERRIESPYVAKQHLPNVGWDEGWKLPKTPVVLKRGVKGAIEAYRRVGHKPTDEWAADLWQYFMSYDQFPVVWYKDVIEDHMKVIRFIADIWGVKEVRDVPLPKRRYTRG